mmetsp:Transcript_16439/g.24420  ORF Transcript_16439/g.24420 Transcript_16439/m.24420 type:complete len:400 (-) Transcript_16439:183-1382(-)
MHEEHQLTPITTIKYYSALHWIQSHYSNPSSKTVTATSTAHSHRPSTNGRLHIHKLHQVPLRRNSPRGMGYVLWTNWLVKFSIPWNLTVMKTMEKKSTISYNDLVQEGMIALLRAMSTYTNYTSLGTKNKSITSFEQYAKEAIHSSFLQFLATTSRPIRLPASLQTTLEAANTAAKYLRNKLGKEPSLAQVAKEVDVNPEQLALYRKLYRKMVGRVGTFVSMEDGLEVYDPSLAGYVGNGLRARSDSDAVTSSDEDDASSSTSSTSTTPADVPSTLLQLNTQEDDWTRQPPERSVAPLRDVFTDTEEINNPLSYTHHFILNEELNQFLCETLSTVELEVIQLRFGLVDSKYGGRGWSAQDIGERVGMEREEVIKVATVALEKLRQAAAADDDAFVEVSL